MLLEVDNEITTLEKQLKPSLNESSTQNNATKDLIDIDHIESSLEEYNPYQGLYKVKTDCKLDNVNSSLDSKEQVVDQFVSRSYNKKLYDKNRDLYSPEKSGVDNIQITCNSTLNDKIYYPSKRSKRKNKNMLPESFCEFSPRIIKEEGEDGIVTLGSIKHKIAHDLLVSNLSVPRKTCYFNHQEYKKQSTTANSFKVYKYEEMLGFQRIKNRKASNYEKLDKIEDFYTKNDVLTFRNDYLKTENSTEYGNSIDLDETTGNNRDIIQNKLKAILAYRKYKLLSHTESFLGDTEENELGPVNKSQNDMINSVQFTQPKDCLTKINFELKKKDLLNTKKLKPKYETFIEKNDYLINDQKAVDFSRSGNGTLQTVDFRSRKFIAKRNQFMRKNGCVVSNTPRIDNTTKLEENECLSVKNVNRSRNLNLFLEMGDDPLSKHKVREAKTFRDNWYQKYKKGQVIKKTIKKDLKILSNRQTPTIPYNVKDKINLLNENLNNNLKKMEKSNINHEKSYINHEKSNINHEKSNINQEKSNINHEKSNINQDESNKVNHLLKKSIQNKDIKRKFTKLNVEFESYKDYFSVRRNQNPMNVNPVFDPKFSGWRNINDSNILSSTAKDQRFNFLNKREELLRTPKRLPKQKNHQQKDYSSLSIVRDPSCNDFSQSFSKNFNKKNTKSKDFKKDCQEKRVKRISFDKTASNIFTSQNNKNVKEKIFGKMRKESDHLYKKPDIIHNSSTFKLDKNENPELPNLDTKNQNNEFSIGFYEDAQMDVSIPNNIKGGYYARAPVNSINSSNSIYKI